MLNSDLNFIGQQTEASSVAKRSLLCILHLNTSVSSFITFISYLTKAEFKNKPEAKDLSSGSGQLQESEFSYMAAIEHDIPLEFWGV